MPVTGNRRLQPLAVLFAVLTSNWSITPAAWSQSPPFPPRLNEDAVRVVSAEDRLVQIQMLVPKRDTDQQPIPSGSRVGLNVYLSHDQGRTYDELLELSGDRQVIIPERGTATATLQVSIPPKVWEQGGVFLSASTTLNSMESKQTRSYLSFLTEEPFTSFRQPVELRRELKDRGGSAGERAVEERYEYSEQQQTFVEKFGEPDLFEVIYQARSEDNELARLERWLYLEPRAALTFSDGQLANLEEFAGMPAIRTKPLYKPSQIGPQLTAADIRAMVPSQQTWQIETSKFEFESKLFEDVSLRLGKGLIAGYKSDALVYVRSLPNWPANETVDAGMDSQDSSQAVPDQASQESHAYIKTTLAGSAIALASQAYPAFVGTGANLLEPLSSSPSFENASLASPIDPLSAGATVFAIGSLAYGLYGLGGDLNKIDEAGQMTIQLYQATNRALEETDDYFNQKLDSGNLSKAEHQRLREMAAQVRSDLEAAQADLVKNQAALTGEAAFWGAVSVATLRGGITRISNFVRSSDLPVGAGLRYLAHTLGQDASGTGSFLFTALGDGASYVSGERPAVLSPDYINQVMDSVATRASEFDRTRYHQSQIRHQVIGAWNRWDDQVSRDNMTNAERTQAFYEMIDQLRQDGWQVEEGLEDYAIGLVSNLTGVQPDDIPPARDTGASEMESIVAKGTTTEEWKTHFRTLMVNLLESVDIFGDKLKVRKFVIRSEPVEMMISKDRIATIEAATLVFEVTMDDGQSSVSHAVITFNEASGEAIELSDTRNDKGEYYVTRVRGTGKVNINDQVAYDTTWRVNYQGFGRWQLVATMPIPGDDQEALGVKSLSVVFELQQPESQ